MPIDIGHLRSWIGREEVAEDVITPVPAAALSATLDRDDPKPQPGDELPPLGHWLSFLPAARPSGLGTDGHPKRGGFLPHVPLPRRMWAGARFEFHQPLRIGESIVRKSTIADVSAKEGRTGPLIFVLVRHHVPGPSGLAFVEEHDIGPTGPPSRGELTPPPRAPPWQGAAWPPDIHTDEAMLFRDSAVTLLVHWLHYDRR